MRPKIPLPLKFDIFFEDGMMNGIYFKEPSGKAFLAMQPITFTLSTIIVITVSLLGLLLLVQKEMVLGRQVTPA